MMCDIGSETKRSKEVVEDYKSWRKNVPLLYDMVITTSYTWPSLSCQWYPTAENVEGKNYSIHKLLLGTNTSGEDKEYVQIASVYLPKDLGSDQSENQEESETLTSRIEITQKINHIGEVNKARYMPQNTNIISTFSSTGQVFVFDTNNHPSMPENDACSPELELVGHNEEGFGMAWNPLTKGELLTASSDDSICLWDIESSLSSNKKLSPLRTYKGHNSYVEDVAFSPDHDKIFASVGDDFRMILWDGRLGPEQKTNSVQAHSGNANCVEFCPFGNNLIATAGADKIVNVWDMRNLKQKLHSLLGHQEEIRTLRWSPTSPTVLGTSSLDRQIIVWDTLRIGQEQTPEDAEDGPPELIFCHNGHTGPISDFSWNPSLPWTVASVAEDNVCQVWQMAKHVYTPED